MFEIPDIYTTVKKIYEWYDSKEFIKDLYENIIISKWEEELYSYFSQVYEELFANLLLKKTFVSNDTKKVLELLATPIYKKSEIERKHIYDKIDTM